MYDKGGPVDACQQRRLSGGEAFQLKQRDRHCQANLTFKLCRSLLTGHPITIHHSDRIVGDCDGVVSIPAAKVPEPLHNAQRREADERSKIAGIKVGERTVDLYNLAQS